MGSSPPSPAFLAVFRAQADADGSMPFARFMELALYHPAVGYYRRGAPRIGYARGTDFFTASSSGALFGELVAAACQARLAAAGRDPREHHFVEIGAEADEGILRGVNHPFASARAIRIGDPVFISGPCVVFSNELFDAQPFVRTVARANQWHEVRVRLDGDVLTETESPAAFAEPATSEGYRFDRPLAAAALAERLAAQDWQGLFVAFDYGKTWRALIEETPAGTARAYYRHTQSNDLLARPGEQDLTCHVCWDWMAAALHRHGFSEPQIDFQETFFLRHAGPTVAAISEAEAAGFSHRKLALMQLLHPGHLGQKFQVMHALRLVGGAPSASAQD